MTHLAGTLFLFLHFNTSVNNMGSADRGRRKPESYCINDIYHFMAILSGAPNDNFRKIICSEDDLRSRIFESFSVKFFKKWYNCPFLTDFYRRKVT